MTEQVWIRSHVERLLQEQWQTCRVHPDGDGDYMFRKGTAAGWVSVLSSEPVMVRVFAHAVHGLKPSLAVLRELNDIQSRSLSTSIGLIHGWVTVSQTISPIALSQEVLAQAISAVGAVANDIGVLLAGVFGGTTPFPVEAGAEEEVA